MASFKVNVKDAVGNLGIKMWEHEITGEIISVESAEDVTTPTAVAKSAPDEGLDIKDIEAAPEPEPKPVVEVSREKPSIVWTTQPPEEVNVGEEVKIKGQLKPEMGKSMPLELTIATPDGAIYVSQIDTDPSGIFGVNMPLTSRGKWKIYAEWKGDSEYAAAKSKVITFQTVTEKTGPDKMEKTTSFLKKNTLIIGAVFLYIVIIRLYRG